MRLSSSYLTVLVRAGDVPDEEKVRKQTGAKVYTLQRSVPFFGDATPHVKAHKSAVFLVSHGSVDGGGGPVAVNAVSVDEIVAWDVHIERLHRILEENIYDK